MLAGAGILARSRGGILRCLFVALVVEWDGVVNDDVVDALGSTESAVGQHGAELKRR